MALRYSYKNRMGHYTLRWENKDYKVWFCHANAICAMLYFYKDEEDGKKVDMVQLQGFFADIKHAKACLDDDFFRNCRNFTFYAKELDKSMWELIKLMTTKYGIKVTIK